jgi:hypothetical protein
MADTTIEQRLSRLEAEVAELKQRIDSSTGDGNWIARISGSMKDEPAFDEVLRLGREIRQADRPPDDD